MTASLFVVAGAGLVHPYSSTDTGLVYDAAVDDYIALMSGAEPGFEVSGAQGTTSKKSSTADILKYFDGSIQTIWSTNKAKKLHFY